MSPPPGFPSAMTSSRHWTARKGSGDGASPAADTPRQHASSTGHRPRALDTGRRSMQASSCSCGRGPRADAIGRSLVAAGGWNRAPAAICGRGGEHGRVPTSRPRTGFLGVNAKVCQRNRWVRPTGCFAHKSSCFVCTCPPADIFILPLQVGPAQKFRKFFRKLDGVVHFAFPEISAEICPG